MCDIEDGSTLKTDEVFPQIHCPFMGYDVHETRSEDRDVASRSRRQVQLWSMIPHPLSLDGAVSFGGWLQRIPDLIICL